MGGAGIHCELSGLVINCISYFNSGANYSNYDTDSTSGRYEYCCVTPALPPGNNGGGNITVDPKFVNAGTGNYRLQSSSPCINAGTNYLEVYTTTDLDGNARLQGPIVDIGAYEHPANSLDCSFNADKTQGLAPLSVHFSAQVSGTNTVNVYYRWDFDNDGIIDCEGFFKNDPEHVYSNGGVFSVSLTVSNDVGETKTHLKVII